MSVQTGPPSPHFRDAPALDELFVGVFRRDVLAFFPPIAIDADGDNTPIVPGGPDFRLLDGPAGGVVEVEMFGVRYRLSQRDGTPFTPQDRLMIRAIGAVSSLRYLHLFRAKSQPRLDLYRGGSEDHYIAAFVEPSAYSPDTTRPSRIAATIQILRTTALSTYENHRVSTGALLLGPLDDPAHLRPSTPPDALAYGVELTGLKSIHRLCDGKRTLFLVDRSGRLADIVDVDAWAARAPARGGPGVPCRRVFEAHARATVAGGHICLVLSPNQEIKLFAGGTQVFAFAHGRWRILDPSARYAVWEAAVGAPAVARVLFQAAMDLAEDRRGGLFVVVGDPCEAVGRLIAPHDLLAAEVPCGPPPELAPRDPLAKRALHYLARGKALTELAPAVLEALAGIDGALAVDRDGRLLAFGAILRHDAVDLPGLAPAEGARTTAAQVASRFGPVLKVSEDGVVSCYLDGARAWDL